jgi:beta-ureidopropionase / N-carbamoyl-L-amino-acid hydrolase
MLKGQSNAEFGRSAQDINFGTRIVERARRLAHFSESSDGLTCTFFSPAHKATASQLREWMSSAGLQAEIDAMGNVIGHYPGSPAATKSVIVASHYDTVINGGQFDGRLGILTALVVAEYLSNVGRRLPFHLDVVAFSEEEGVRFSLPYLGSSAIAGRFEEVALESRDANGIRLAHVLGVSGPSAIQALARPANALAGYLEVHIEQGPILLEKELPVGVVTSIAGATRFHITISGVAGHAGTVPMARRHDAAAAAAEIILAVEKRCSAAPTLVGTVGQLAVPGGAINVIPGRCELSLDMRAAEDTARDAAVIDILRSIDEISARRGVTIGVKEVARQAAVPCAVRLQSAFANAIARMGIEPLYLSSGAGHDAVMFAGLTDIGMLFVRCGNGGISHSPLETVTEEDADFAARVLLDTLVNLD